MTGLDVIRAERGIDPALLRSTELGYLNGHVPVTGILSAIAVMAAVGLGRDAVVMSNEWSASFANLVVDGRAVNHQWSKGIEFEEGLRSILAATFAPAPDYFSLLRARSELWVAPRFATLDRYHRAFRSCNRAFAHRATARLDTWCGRCDKCCFIDLILAPFLSAARARRRLRRARAAGRPRPGRPVPRAARHLGQGAKPFECVGDERECRAALPLAAARPDRARERPPARSLAAEVGRAGGRRGPGASCWPRSAPHFVPDGYARRSSAGLTSRGARSGSGGSGSRAAASLPPAAPPSAPHRCWSTTTPADGEARGPRRCSPPRRGAWRPSRAATWW